MSINTDGQNKRLYCRNQEYIRTVLMHSCRNPYLGIQDRRATGASQDRSPKEKRKGRVLQAHAKIRPRVEFLVGKYECIESKAHHDSCKGALKKFAPTATFLWPRLVQFFFNAPFSCARPKKRRHPCHAHLKLRGGRAQTGRSLRFARPPFRVTYSCESEHW